MHNTITELEISNFKSIKNIKMDCKRINVLIGRPNVGKSNILEALSLFITPYDSSQFFLKEYVRYEKINNLFYDQDRKNAIIIKSDIGVVALRYHMNNINAYDILVLPDERLLNIMNQPDNGFSLNEKGSFLRNEINKIPIDKTAAPPLYYYGSVSDNSAIHALYTTSQAGYDTPIKNYKFKPLNEFTNHFPLFLSPPHGDNLYTILEGNPELYEEFAAFFNAYHLDLTLNVTSEKIEIQKKVGRRVYASPYSLSADTLQRIIFHLAAIKTNKNSIILFEEPENHSFPAYISQVADAVIESKDNQFFIATHSPYLLMPFIEQCPFDDIAIFIVDYENHATIIKALSKEEMQDILDSGVDIFFNLSAYK